MAAKEVPIANSWNTEQWDWPLQQNDGVVQVTNTSDLFEVTLDAACFTPKEIGVKVVKNQLVIHCMHDSRSDEYGEVKREINRTYTLPSDIDTDSLRSNLTKRGHLVITAGKKH